MEFLAVFQNKTNDRLLKNQKIRIFYFQLVNISVHLVNNPIHHTRLDSRFRTSPDKRYIILFRYQRQFLRKMVQRSKTGCHPRRDIPPQKDTRRFYHLIRDSGTGIDNQQIFPGRK